MLLIIVLCGENWIGHYVALMLSLAKSDAYKWIFYKHDRIFLILEDILIMRNKLI